MMVCFGGEKLKGNIDMQMTLENILKYGYSGDDWWMGITLAYGPEWDSFPYPLSKVHQKMDSKDWEFFVLNLEILDEKCYMFKHYTKRKEHIDFEQKLQTKYDLWFINWEEGTWDWNVS